MGNLIQDAVMNAVNILKLDENAINKASKGNFVNTVVIFAIVAIVSAIGALWGNGGFFSVLIGGFIGLFIGSFIWTGIVWLVAKLLGGKGDYMEQYKPASNSTLVTVLNIIPVVGGIISGIWSIVANIVVVKTVHKFSTLKAVIAVLLPVVVVIIIAVILVMLVAVTFLSAFGGLF